MTTSLKTQVATLIKGSDPLPVGLLEYICSGAQHAHFDYIHRKLSEAETRGLTRTALARRIGVGKTRLSHLLGSPGNWTIDTFTKLLIGISRETSVPHSRSLIDQPRRNFTDQDLLDPEKGTTGAKVFSLGQRDAA